MWLSRELFGEFRRHGYERPRTPSLIVDLLECVWHNCNGDADIRRESMRLTSLHSKCLLLTALLVVGLSPAWAASSILYMGEQADLIVLGEGLAALSTTQDGDVVFRIRWDSVLKGEMPQSPSFEATLEASGMGGIMHGRAIWEANAKEVLPEMYGLWFLQTIDGAAYRIVPPLGQIYGRRDAVVELPQSWVPPIVDDLERNLLAAARDHFRFRNSEALSESAEDLLLRSLEYGGGRGSPVAAWEVITELMDSPSERERSVGTVAAMQMTYRDRTTAPLLAELESLAPDERMRLAAASRDAVSRDAALAVVNRLMDSGEPGERTIGVVLGLQLHYDAALEKLSSDLDSLRHDPNFAHINFNLHFLYRRPPRPFEHELWIDPLPTEPDPLAVLVRLIERRSGAPGLDQAIGGTLYRIMKRHDTGRAPSDGDVDKNVLPAAALLLESSDPGAKEGGVQVFHVYGAFSHSGAGNRGPSAWQEERKHFGGSVGDASVDERAAFWLEWWSANREKLGFRPAVPSTTGQGN